VDPLTLKTVGPLCISRIADPERRKAMMALAHFPEKTIRQYQANNRDPSFMVVRLYVHAYSTTVLLVISTVIAIATFGWLDINSRAWVPIVGKY
jgi:hypothetical protein